MASPRVWSRDDFLEAFRLAQPFYLEEAKKACEVLAFAERNAVLRIAQPRDESGRFARKPELHVDSPIVTTARAGG